MTGKKSEFKLSTAIMTHPGRIEAARSLARSIVELSPKIVVDPTPTGRTIDNAVRAWNAVEDDATHHLVLQDDCHVCSGFIPMLRSAISEMPHCALSFFTTWSSRTSNVVRIAALHGSRWAEICDYYLPCVALVLPAWMARSFSLSQLNGVDLEDDSALLEYITKHDVRAYMHVPNLVQHSELPTVARNDVGTRLSVYFHDDATAMGVRRGITEAGTILPQFSWYRRQNYWLHRGDIRQQWYEINSEESVLEYIGINLDKVHNHYKKARQAHSGVIGIVDDGSQYALWLSAFGLGIAAASSGNVYLNTDAAQIALGTLAPGAWRLMVADHVIARHRVALAKFVAAAVGLGVSYVKNGHAPAIHDISLPSSFLGRRALSHIDPMNPYNKPQLQ